MPRRTSASCRSSRCQRPCQDHLQALRLRRDRAINRARSVGEGMPSIFQNCGVSPRRYDFADEVGQHRGTAHRVERLIGLLPSRHEDFDDQLSSRATAPRLEHVQLVPLASADLVLVVRSKADQDLDERADERPLKRLRRPCERKGAGLLGGSSDVQTVATCLDDDVGRVPVRPAAARRTRARAVSDRARAGSRRRRAA